MSNVTEVCTDSVPRPSKCTEIVGGWGFAPDPTGGAYSAPPDPLAGLRGLLLRDLLLRGGEGILLRNSFRGLVTPLCNVHAFYAFHSILFYFKYQAKGNAIDMP